MNETASIADVFGTPLKGFKSQKIKFSLHGQKRDVCFDVAHATKKSVH
jgi:hypothetical protein